MTELRSDGTKSDRTVSRKPPWEIFGLKALTRSVLEPRNNPTVKNDAKKSAFLTKYIIPQAPIIAINGSAGNLYQDKISTSPEETMTTQSQ